MAKAVVFIAFTTAWCAPCRHFKADFAGDASVTIMDVEENKELADSYEVTGFPTVLALVDGQEVARTVGYNNKPEMVAWMNRVLDRNQ